MTQSRFFLVLATAFVVTFTVTSLRHSKKSAADVDGLPLGMQFCETSDGLEVAALQPRAQAFGFEQGDVIKSIDQKKVEDYRSLLAAILDKSDRDVLSVTVQRGESLLTINRRFEGPIQPAENAKALVWKQQARSDGTRVIDEFPEYLLTDTSLTVDASEAPAASDEVNAEQSESSLAPRESPSEPIEPRVAKQDTLALQAPSDLAEPGHEIRSTEKQGDDGFPQHVLSRIVPPANNAGTSDAAAHDSSMPQDDRLTIDGGIDIDAAEDLLADDSTDGSLLLDEAAANDLHMEVTPSTDRDASATSDDRVPLNSGVDESLPTNPTPSEYDSQQFHSTDSLLTQDAEAHESSDERIDQPSLIEEDEPSQHEVFPSPSDRSADPEGTVIENPWAGQPQDRDDDRSVELEQNEQVESDGRDQIADAPAQNPISDESFEDDGDQSDLFGEEDVRESWDVAPDANESPYANAQGSLADDSFGPPPVDNWPSDGSGRLEPSAYDGWSTEGVPYADYTPQATCPTWRELIYFGGWLSTGYHSESNDLFNDRPEEINLHQGWLLLGKETATGNPFGGRVDLMYGIDGDEAQAFGNRPEAWDFQNGFDHGSYAWAIPQAYGQVGGNDWDIKAGRFVTILGFESIAATSNFFYSRSMAFTLLEPRTHTGVLARKQFSKRFEVFAGWTLGWDTGFDQLGGGSAWLGGTRYWLTDNIRWTSSTTAGDLGWRGENGAAQTYLFEVHLTERVHTVTQADLFRVDSTGEDGVALLQYLFVNVSDSVRLGTRFEWWKGDRLTGYAPHGGVLPTGSGNLSYYAATVGANVCASNWLVVRPELRYDWSPAAGYDEAYFGIDAILQY